ncbi:hypothetical protein HNY73_019914 [Argiope bruennichi]|uniref:Uncharacterized protein n=1 Tax=Argiope bruennichi TaxID=94029 RepID=A0A8T0E5Y1_ARGBR|nr:hypothetical protein HNY73_019914 [Argiope bruennichi]
MAASKTVFCFTLVFVLLQCITIPSAVDGATTVPPAGSNAPAGAPTGAPAANSSMPKNPAGMTLPVTVPM